MSSLGATGSITSTAEHLTLEQIQEQTEPGAILEFQHNSNTHYALYLGKGRVMSIDTETGHAIYEAYIQEHNLYDVVGESKVKVSNHDDIAKSHFQAIPRHSREAVQKAWFYQHRVVPFEFDFRNSEYYCTLWRYGKGFSTQAEEEAKKNGSVSVGDEYSKYKQLAVIEQDAYSNDYYH